MAIFGGLNHLLLKGSKQIEFSDDYIWGDLD